MHTPPVVPRAQPEPARAVACCPPPLRSLGSPRCPLPFPAAATPTCVSTHPTLAPPPPPHARLHTHTPHPHTPNPKHTHLLRVIEYGVHPLPLQLPRVPLQQAAGGGNAQAQSYDVLAWAYARKLLEALVLRAHHEGAPCTCRFPGLCRFPPRLAGLGFGATQALHAPSPFV